MKDGVPEQPSGFTYVLSQVSDGALSPHPLPALRYQELLHGAMRKKRREWKQLGRPPQRANQCPRPRAGTPSARPRAAAGSVATAQCRRCSCSPRRVRDAASQAGQFAPTAIR